MTVGGLKGLGLIKEKGTTTRGSSNTQAGLDSTWAKLHETSQRLTAKGPPSRRGGGQEWAEGGLERAHMSK